MAVWQQLEDPVVEAATLVGRRPWDSTRAELFEGEVVSILVSPRQGARPGMSDVSITMVVRRDGPLDAVGVTLAGAEGCREGRLDARGRCVIRDVADGRYRLGFCRL
jgi:hypothetical protein